MSNPFSVSDSLFLSVSALYLLLINVFASLITCTDKYRAKRSKWRIPENTLMLLGFFGGALGEYITMKLVRHKTLHKKFMIGLPLFILLHIGIIFLLLYMQK